MRRRPEPELMDTAEQARAYAETDFSDANELFLDLLAEQGPGDLIGARAMDLGCGPADIVIRFLRRYPQATCDAVDGSRPMLDLAQADLDALPGIARRARLIHERLPSAALEPSAYDLILSNSLLHHLHEPMVLWETVKRLGKPGALVLIMDLTRPASPGWARALVESYAPNAPAILKQDFESSLHAAFEPTEITAQLQTAGLADRLEVHVVSDRHVAVWGRLV